MNLEDACTLHQNGLARQTWGDTRGVAQSARTLGAKTLKLTLSLGILPQQLRRNTGSQIEAASTVMQMLLDSQRSVNARSAQKIIERAGEVEVTASAVVAAVQALMRFVLALH